MAADRSSELPPEPSDRREPLADDAGEKTPAAKKPNWIDTLAQRSTGLPSDEPRNAPPPADDPSLWKWAGMGLQFAASVAIFLLIGRWIDKQFGWNYAATLLLLAIALIGNFYLLIKDASRNNK